MFNPHRRRPEGNPESDGYFQMTSSFLFDGQLAQVLYAGGAYSRSQIEKDNSLAFCEALFGSRFSEVSYFSSHGV